MNCATHEKHEHTHGPTCGHKAIKHDGHTDYIHEGHLHHVHEGHIDEHAIAETSVNKNTCTPEHKCHGQEHVHGSNCGHEAVPHGNHVDYVVAGHLHHPCNSHCDIHGELALV